MRAPRREKERIAAISKPYPRKGTETYLLDILDFRISDFKTISPQGDGNFAASIESSEKYQFQNHIPARGRKLTRPMNLPTYFKFISKPYPRKGTETRSATSVPLRRRSFQNHIPARGRKLILLLCFLASRAKFQNHIPARGRKL